MAQTNSLDLESGSSQYASISDASQTGLNVTTDFTLEAWIKIESFAGGEPVIMSRWTTGGDQRSFRFIVESTQLRLDTSSTGANETNGTQAFSFKTGIWYHVAVSKTGTTATFYVNGRSLGTGSAVSTLFDGSSDFAVGAIGNPSAYFDGLIKDVRVFNDVRTQNEIVSDAWTETVSNANLQGQWNFNNAYTDSSGNGNTLSPTNTPTFPTTIPWTAPSAGENIQVSANMVSWWTFNDVLTDAHSTNNLTGVNSPTYAAAKWANGIDLERGSSQYAYVDDTAALEPGSAFSIAGWMNLESATTGAAYVIASKGTSTGNQRQFVFKVNDAGTITLQLSSAGTSYDGDVNASWSESTGTFIHVAVTYGSGVTTFYINGIAVGTTTSAVTSVFNGTGRFGFGAENISGTPGDFFDGILDEFSLYNIQLDYGNILDLYAAGNGIPYAAAAGPTNLNTWDGVTKANTKTINGVAMASVKTVDGIS